jgi:hypothetical protein
VLAAWAIIGLFAFLDTGTAAPAPPGRLVPLGLVAVGVVALMLSGSHVRASGPARVVLAQSGSGSGTGGSTA